MVVNGQGREGVMTGGRFSQIFAELCADGRRNVFEFFLLTYPGYESYKICEKFLRESRSVIFVKRLF